MDLNTIDSLNESLCNKNERETHFSPLEIQNKSLTKKKKHDKNLRKFSINKKHTNKIHRSETFNKNLNVDKYNKNQHLKMEKNNHINKVSKNTIKDDKSQSRGNQSFHKRAKPKKTSNKNLKYDDGEKDKIDKFHQHPSLLEKLTLSDVKMYYKFGGFPYIMVIHIMIVIFTTYSV